MIRLRAKAKNLITLFMGGVLSAFLCAPPGAALAAKEATSAVQAQAPEEPSLRWVNFRISPVGILFGIYGMDLQVGVLRRVAIGTSFYFFRVENTNSTLIAKEMGVELSVHLTGERFSGGVVLEPGAYFIPINTYRGAATTQTENWSYAITAGYEWAWQSGFNAHLGVGFSDNQLREPSRIQPTAAAHLGWAI